MSRNFGFEPVKEKPFCFVSYRAIEAKRVAPIVKQLHERGVRIWYDQGLQLGNRYETVIAKKIRASSLVLLFCTKSIFRQKKSFVRRESGLAEEYGKEIYPVMLDEINIDNEEEVLEDHALFAEHLKELHCVEAFRLASVTEIVDTIMRDLPDEVKTTCKESASKEINDTAHESNENVPSNSTTPTGEHKYLCPYCDKEITEKTILFCWEDRTAGLHPDKRRSDFRDRHGVNPSLEYDGLYYPVTDDSIVFRDKNGFPMMLEALPIDGIAPDDLPDEPGKFHNIEHPKQADVPAEKIRIIERACPHCHSRLPKEFGTLKTYHVALFGGRAAGKSSYLINMLQQLPSQLTEYGIGSFTLESESKIYWDRKLNEYAKTGIVVPTPVSQKQMPIVCRFTNADDVTRSAFFVFWDIAGEAIGDGNFIVNHRGLSECDTLFLMIDPNMLCNGRYSEEWHIEQQGRNTIAGLAADDCCTMSLSDFLLNATRMVSICATQLKNVIAIVTKLDMMITSERGSYPFSELLRNTSSKYPGKYDLASAMKVENELCSFFNTKYHVELKKRLKNIFGEDKKINILGVSTSTIQRNAGSDKSFRFFQQHDEFSRKHRIIDPFLFLLWRHGLIYAIRPIKDANGHCVDTIVLGNTTQPPQSQQKKKWSLMQIFTKRNKQS